jgi:putative Ca2+/H+ antiporter (TMEM165/GDT1 family)
MVFMHTLSTTLGTVLALICPKIVTSIIVVILFLGFGFCLLITTFKEQKCFTKDPITGRRTRDPPESEDEFEETKKEVEEHEAIVAELEKKEK